MGKYRLTDMVVQHGAVRANLLHYLSTRSIDVAGRSILQQQGQTSDHIPDESRRLTVHRLAHTEPVTVVRIDGRDAAVGIGVAGRPVGLIVTVLDRLLARSGHARAVATRVDRECRRPFDVADPKPVRRGARLSSGVASKAHSGSRTAATGKRMGSSLRYSATISCNRM